MTTQPTQDEVPSESPRDLKFNAGKIDEFVTAKGHTYSDRFGNLHYTIEGLGWLAQQAIATFGWIPVGTFQKGSTLTLPNQILKDEVTNEYYRWDGSFQPSGKIVPVDSTPDTSGGVGIGAWISVGDSSLRSMLATSVGAAMIGMKNGGTVQDVIISVYVDAFPGADNTGATSSNSAVLSALAAINIVVDSTMDKTPSVPYAEVIFGKGDYACIDIPCKSGVRFRGQGGYSTLIKPDTSVTSTSGYIFTTVGTQPYFIGREPKRCFRPMWQDMVIGYDRQRIYTTAIPQNNIGGIQLKYASYAALKDVQFNSLDGIGLQLSEIWDSTFDNVRFLAVGNARNPLNPRWALMIWSGDDADHLPDLPQDGCDTLRFTNLHIENTDAQIYIGKRSKMITFNGAKLEGGKTTDAVSNIIAGATGVTFDNYQLSWSIGTKPMFSIVGTGPVDDTSDSDPSATYQGNHSRRVIFSNGQIANSENNTGWYFEYGSGRGPLLIDGGTGHHMRYLCTGSNFKIHNFECVQCGPLLISGSGDVILENISVYRHRVPSTGTANVITLTGVGNRVSRCRFYTPYDLLPVD